MRITKEAEYAMRVISHLALNKGERISANIISEDEGIPNPFLLKILRKLRQNELVISHRGVYGGYELSRHPSKITLKDVIETIDGPIAITSCQEDPESCKILKKNTGPCEIEASMAWIQQSLIEKLSTVNFENIFDETYLEDYKFKISG